MPVELSSLCLQVYDNVIFLKLGIKKSGNWQGLSNFSTWTNFSPKKLSDIAKFFVISEPNNQNNNQHNNNENIHSSQENTTYTIQVFVCIVLFSLVLELNKQKNRTVWLVQNWLDRVTGKVLMYLIICSVHRV